MKITRNQIEDDPYDQCGKTGSIHGVINEFENHCSSCFVSIYFHMILCQNKLQHMLSRN